MPSFSITWGIQIKVTHSVTLVSSECACCEELTQKKFVSHTNCSFNFPRFITCHIQQLHMAHSTISNIGINVKMKSAARQQTFVAS